MPYPEFGPQSHEDPVGNSGVSGTHIFRGFYRGRTLASGTSRLCSGAIDYAPAIFAYYWLGTIGHVMAAAWLWWNVVYMQARTSQSIGKLVMGTRVVVPSLNPNNSNAYWAAPTSALLTWRLTINVLMIWMWPLAIIAWIRLCLNARQESFADSWSNTLVLKDAGDIELSPVKGARDR